MKRVRKQLVHVVRVKIMLSGVARRYLARPGRIGVPFTRRSLSCSPLRYEPDKLRVAIIGQSLFGLEVYKHLRVLGHEVAGVFTIPGKDVSVHKIVIQLLIML